MKQIMNINESLPDNAVELDEIIVELTEREEFLCTGNACGADAGLI